MVSAVQTLFLINPTSGRDRSAHLKRTLLDRVADMPDAQAIVLTYAGEAYRIAKDAASNGCDKIIVAGGDGTVNEVINGIGDSCITLGIVPLGTGNVLAYELGIKPEDIDHALSIIAGSNVREFDLGLAGNTRFLLMAGFGFDAEVVRSVPSRSKGIFGRMAYAPMLIRESVRYRPSEFCLTLDGETSLITCAYNVIVCNCSSYAPNLHIAPDIRPDDAMLDLLIFENRPAMKLRFLGWLSASMVTKWAADPCAIHHRVKQVRIESKPTVKMQVDGDMRGKSGIDIKILPKALRLITP